MTFAEKDVAALFPTGPDFTFITSHSAPKKRVIRVVGFASAGVAADPVGHSHLFFLVSAVLNARGCDVLIW